MTDTDVFVSFLLTSLLVVSDLVCFLTFVVDCDLLTEGGLTGGECSSVDADIFKFGFALSSVDADVFKLGFVLSALTDLTRVLDGLPTVAAESLAIDST